MNKKKITSKRCKGYFKTWKSGNIKVVNFQWEGNEGLTYAIWVMKKSKVGIKKPFAEYIGKIKFDAYIEMKPLCYKYQWHCILHSGYGKKIKDFNEYRNIEEEIKMLTEHAKDYKGNGIKI